MAEFNIYSDTDTVSVTRDGTDTDPWDGIVEALSNTTFVRGNDYIFHHKGTALDDVNDNNGVGIDYSGISGTGDLRITIQSWDGETDGRYTGKDNISTSHSRIGNTATASNNPIFFVVGDNNTADVNEINFEFLQLINETGGVAKCVEIRGGVRGTVSFLQCAIKSGTTGTFPRAIRVDGAAASLTLKVKNCLFIGTSGALSSINLNDGATTFVGRCNAFIYDTGVGEDALDDVSGDSVDFQLSVMRGPSAGVIEIDSVNSPTLGYNASQTSGDRGTGGTDCAEADFTDFGVADTNENSPAASQTNAWADSGRGNNDDSEIPLIDKTGGVRDPDDTSAGCFARADEADTGQNLTAALFTDSDTFLASTITTGSVDVIAPLFADADTFPGPTIRTQTDLVATLFSDADAFGAATITATRDLLAALFSDADAFGAHTISSGNTIVASLFTDPDTFPAHAVAPGALTLAASLLADGDTFPGHTVSVGAADLIAPLFTDTDAFFGPVISTGLTVSPGLYVDPDTFPAQTVNAGAVDLIASLFTDLDTFETHDINTGINLSALLYVDPDTFPSPMVTPGDVTLVGSAFVDPDTFPAPVIAQELFLTGTLYVDGDVFNVHQVIIGDLVTLPLPGSPFSIVDRTLGGAIVDRTVAAKIVEG